MAQLMALLADPDSSIRNRALALLHQVDSGLTALLRAQLQAAVDSEATNHHHEPAETSITLAQRLIEVSLFAVFSSA